MRKLLLVDDDEDYAAVVKMRLEKEGFEIDWVPGCEQAILTLEKNPNVDLIILDVEMPERNGLATLAHLKGHFQGRPGGFKIPVIIATGLMSPKLKEIFASQQVADYVQKPFESSVLVQKIEKILAEKKG